MKTLDLHGKTHIEAPELLRSFLNFADLPCEIVTGNSNTMKLIAKRIVQEYKWFCYEKSSYNHGALIVVDKRL